MEVYRMENLRTTNGMDMEFKHIYPVKNMRVISKIINLKVMGNLAILMALSMKETNLITEKMDKVNLTK